MDTFSKYMGKQLALLLLGLSISFIAAAEDSAVSVQDRQQLTDSLARDMQQFRHEALQTMADELHDNMDRVLADGRELTRSQLAEAEKQLYPEKQPFRQAECSPDRRNETDLFIM